MIGSIPWLFVCALLGIGINVLDLFAKVAAGSQQRSALDYVFLTLMVMLNLAPFFAVDKLLDTRTFCATALRPLLASRAIARGVQVGN